LSSQDIVNTLRGEEATEGNLFGPTLVVNTKQRENMRSSL